ncbi:hypothetical protein BaRGS_00036095 [Batillaria attramentaria]|uniref:Uncharacterized protein n=1 Tax=Batillaria attramentaria TaxID=370345 RepID=A0ABD0JCW4_9CAEN
MQTHYAKQKKHSVRVTSSAITPGFQAIVSAMNSTQLMVNCKGKAVQFYIVINGGSGVTSDRLEKELVARTCQSSVIVPKNSLL